MSIEARLKELGIALPDAPAPVANYVPAVRVGNLVFVSGQVSAAGGEAVKGKLGEEVSLEDGQKKELLDKIEDRKSVNYHSFMNEMWE